MTIRISPRSLIRSSIRQNNTLCSQNHRSEGADTSLGRTNFKINKQYEYVTGQQTGINKVLGDQLVAAFAKSGKYIAIERTASFLAELGKEQNYQRTGAVDDNELSRLGKQFGVQLVCVADVSDVFGEKYVSSRLIDVESAEVVNTSNATSKLESMQELLSVTDKIAKELTAKTVQEKAAEAAAKQREYELEQGYIQIANLYAIISFSSVAWNQTSSIALECRIGGFSEWRLPTATEVNMVIRGIRQYQSESEFYPNIRSILSSIETSGYFWAADHTAGTFQGNRQYYNDSNLLMLVRDAQ